MFFFIREIAGWCLMILALVLIGIGLVVVSNSEEPQIIEGGLFIVAATVVMRAAVLLVRVSTAARICRTETAPDSLPRKTSA